MTGKENKPKTSEDCLSISLEDKLFRTRYEVDPSAPHIRIREEVCKGCRSRICLFICPAKVYVLRGDDSERMTVNHENCLECGTCRFACPNEGIDWSFPNGGKGVKYRFG